MPVNPCLLCRWQVLKGDASCVVFADATARQTSVTFRKKGYYVIQLAVSDGERTTYSDPIDVTVLARGLMIILR